MAHLTQADWAALVKAFANQRPSLGATIHVTRGSHKGAEGTVIWHGEDRHSPAWRYGDPVQHMGWQAAGRYGFRIRVRADDGGIFFVDADWVDVIPTELIPDGRPQ